MKQHRQAGKYDVAFELLNQASKATWMFHSWREQNSSSFGPKVFAGECWPWDKCSPQGKPTRLYSWCHCMDQWTTRLCSAEPWKTQQALVNGGENVCVCGGLLVLVCQQGGRALPNKHLCWPNLSLFASSGKSLLPWCNSECFPGSTRYFTCHYRAELLMEASLRMCWKKDMDHQTRIMPSPLY